MTVYKISFQEELIDLLKRHSEYKNHPYVNPNFVSLIVEAIEDYGCADDETLSELKDWIINLYGQ